MERKCTACGTVLKYAGQEKLQLGKTSWLLGDLPNLLAGALQVHIYYCPGCGKIEFYAAGDQPAEEGNGMPRVKCPYCGHLHDMDDSRCPYCNQRLMDIT